MRKCVRSPIHKKEYLKDIGRILVKNNGKKKFYKPQEVKEAHRKSKWYVEADFSCWAMSAFSSERSFEEYHSSIGEQCDYLSMKTEMLGESLLSPLGDWDTIQSVDVDASWLEFGDLTEGIVGGFFDFLGGIFDF